MRAVRPERTNGLNEIVAEVRKRVIIVAGCGGGGGVVVVVVVGCGGWFAREREVRECAWEG